MDEDKHQLNGQRSKC